ncbi:MAG: ABC transporter ATP-binding protein [Rickettsiales bacterium]
MTVSVAASPLKVDSIFKKFSAHQVLDDFSLELQPGEIFGLIGLNGAGKTTLIKIILDLLNQDQGEVTLFGESSRTIESRRFLSYLPEKFTPSRYLKGKEYLQLSLSFYNKEYDHAQARAEAESLDLNPDALDRLVGSYSKGMGQKLGLIGAFMIDTPLLILDEPMSGLDPKARILLKAKMLAAKKAGKAIFFSSHILADIDEISDRIAILHDAKRRFLGTAEQFKSSFPGQSLEQAFLSAIEEKMAA